MRLAWLVLCVVLVPTRAAAQIRDPAELNTEQITSLDRAKTVVIIQVDGKQKNWLRKKGLQ